MKRSQLHGTRMLEAEAEIPFRRRTEMIEESLRNGLESAWSITDRTIPLFDRNPMLNGKYCGQDIGSGTDVWKFSEDVKAGVMSLEQFMDAEASMSRSAGHCMVMGTASTMASVVESLGIAMPYNAALPAVDYRRRALAHLVHSVPEPAPEPGPLDWLDWERRKALRLLMA